MRNILIGVFLIILAFAVVIVLQAISHRPKTSHYHAGFQVYKDGKLVNFSDIKYMHVRPCDINGKMIVEDDQLEKAHLHDLVGDVVHVHRYEALWKDLFRNIGYKISGNVEGFVNRQKIPDILNYPIKPYDSLVLFIGSHDKASNYFAKGVRRQHIRDIENRSDTCAQ